MKKFKPIIALIAGLLLLTSLQTFAGDKEFSGTIVYNITYPEGSVDPQMAAMMPKTMKVKIRDVNSRMEMNMGMGSSITLYNSETKTGATLMDMMGQKMAMKITPEDIEKEIAESPQITVVNVDETKEIAGYECKKAIIKIKEKGSDKETELAVYYTDELGSGGMNYNNPMFKDIQGVMLEYTVKEGKIEMTFTAISVEKGKIAESEFEIPEGYNLMTQEEFKSMFGGQ
jgi:GLPGLI family protein